MCNRKHCSFFYPYLIGTQHCSVSVENICIFCFAHSPLLTVWRRKPMFFCSSIAGPNCQLPINIPLRMGTRLPLFNSVLKGENVASMINTFSSAVVLLAFFFLVFFFSFFRNFGFKKRGKDGSNHDFLWMGSDSLGLDCKIINMARI